MIRRLILVFAILAVATVPATARSGGGHGSQGGHGHHGHHRHVHAFGRGVYAGFPYGYPCWWEEGHWVNQLYADKYGDYTYALEWVPGQWGCWY
jgi:hypothetical protein